MSKAPTETKPAVEKPKAREVLFFELEYVAVNGRQLMFDVLKQVMKSKDIEVTPALFARHGLSPRPGASIRAMIDASGRNLTTGDQLAGQAEDLLIKAFGEKAVLNNDLPAIIKAAQEMNIQVVALSAWPEAVARELMKKTGLDRWVSTWLQWTAPTRFSRAPTTGFVFSNSAIRMKFPRSRLLLPARPAKVR